jgi:hypothetical protein
VVATMEKHAAERPDLAEAETRRLALVEIRSLAARGLAKANEELPRADNEKDWENWSLWRGYRQAMLEILAITDKLDLTEIPASHPRPQEGEPEI